MRRVTKQRAIASAAFWWLGLRACQPDSLSSSPSPRCSPFRRSRSAATKHGITPPSPKAGSTIPVGKRPTFKVQASRARARSTSTSASPRRRTRTGSSATTRPIGRAKKKNGKFSVKLDVLRLPRVLAQLAGHLLLAGAPHRLHRGQRPQRLPAGRARSSSSRSADGPHRLLRLELRQLEGDVLPAAPSGAAVAGALRHAVRHRRGQRDLLPARVALGGRRLGAPHARRTSCSRSSPPAT